MTNQNIFIIGPMGVGKTTIGRQLSSALNRSFKDSDKEIEEHTGASIPLIFELEGEEGFRRRESEVIDQLTQMQGIVLATGGGAVLREENRQHLSERGTVIYLYANAEHLYKRTCRSKNRPLLQTEDPMAKIQQLLDQRTHLYESIADLALETGRRTIKSVTKEVLHYVRTHI